MILAVFIKIESIPIMNNNNLSKNYASPYTFKISFNNIVNNTICFNDTDKHQSIYFNRTSFILDELNIVVYNRIGATLTGFRNWTMTLLIEYKN